MWWDNICSFLNSSADSEIKDNVVLIVLVLIYKTYIFTYDEAVESRLYLIRTSVIKLSDHTDPFSPGSPSSP